MTMLGEEPHGDSESFDEVARHDVDVSVVLSHIIDNNFFNADCCRVAKDFVMCNIYGRVLSVKAGTSYAELVGILSSSHWPLHSVTFHDDEASAAEYYAMNVMESSWSPVASLTVDVGRRINEVFIPENRITSDERAPLKWKPEWN